MKRVFTKNKFSKIDEAHMMLAIEEAKKASRIELPIGAIVVYQGDVVGTGRAEDHVSCNPVRHAEVVAVEQACKFLHRTSLVDCTIYSTAEPCPMCASVIFQTKISKIIFGISREKMPIRKRKISIYDLARDSGYIPKIYSGLHEELILQLFT
ncbi:MAG: nucleoside deaminase [Candidatus Pacebacteria bacterium]|nr:nucleoside deaminase [Candidatus Paceibacterota bacterium]